ncbi:MAG TPA: pyridoxal phosphate-dependent aminotransferase [Vicinamibacterales bacterium]|nr:pyridoxal phosphate-dependent aminotransferase [Vicinamibacterales bacterium]
MTEAVRARRASGQALIDLTESNPTRAGFTYPADLLEPLGRSTGLDYKPAPLGSVEARRAIAADYARQGIPVSPDRIVLTASTSDGYSLLFKLLGDAGDEVLVPRPSYPLFDYLTRLDLLVTRYYDLEIDGSWSIDFASVERAITPRTRAVLLVSPNNPTGSFISAADLDRLAAICAARNIAIVADEVFADYELEPGAAGRAGRVTRREDVLSFALGGLSKSVGLPQVKLGWMVVGGSDVLVSAALERLELVCDTYLAVSTPAQLAAAELLERGAIVRSQIRARIASNYQALRAAAAGVPSCCVVPGEGGWYAVLRVPSLEPEEDLVVRLVTDGVLTHPGYFFDFPRESYLIVSLLPSESEFRDGVMRVLRHFDCKVSGT